MEPLSTLIAAAFTSVFLLAIRYLAVLDDVLTITVIGVNFLSYDSSV